MNENLTNQDQAPLAEPLPEVPATPAALFAPMAAPVIEPPVVVDRTVVTEVAAPPVKPPAAATAAKRRWPMFVAIGVLAALAGLALGFVIGMPGRNSLTDQRNTARSELAAAKASLADTQTKLTDTNGKLTTTNADLATTNNKLSAAQSNLATTQKALDTMTTQRDAATALSKTCTAASQAGVDLVAQWGNFLGDYNNLLNTAIDSAAEAQILLHMDEQWAKMADQKVQMDKLYQQCLAG